MPLHVCFLCHEYPPEPHGGVGTVIQALARALVARGHRVTVLGISRRSIAELMRGLTYKTIYQAYVTSRQAKAQFRIMHVPDETKDIGDALRFRPAEMKQLFDVGRTFGRSQTHWQPEPPRLEALERIGAEQVVRC